MKRIVSVLLIMVISLYCVACGKSEKQDMVSLEGDLQEIIEKIYANADLDAELKEAMEGYVSGEIAAENEQAILGVSDVPYIEGIYSVPMISSIAYQCVLLRVEPEDVETVKTMLKENADVNKWVCVSAETVLVENVGDLVLFVMSGQETAYALSAAFMALK